MIFKAARRAVLGLVLGASLVACTAKPGDLEGPQPDMGDFKLGYNIVVVKEPQIGPLSRTATDEEWETALKAEIANRFGSYDGDKLYHIGVKIDAYALGQIGIPVLVKPKSVLVVSANIFDDATQTKLNTEAKQLTVFEDLSAGSVLGSGLTQTKEQQMARLSRNAASEIQKWLLKNPEWFGLPPLASEVKPETPVNSN